MTAPRVEIDLRKIRRNTRFLVDRLGLCGISVTGVTKAVCGHPGVARAMLDGGAVGLADARVANVRRMREAGVTCPLSMIRAPMQSEVADVVGCCDTSYNTEIDTILKLAAIAQQQGKEHSVILMVEMGDMREGILPENLAGVASRVVATPGVGLKGIAANFACLGNAAPTPDDMALLSRLADDLEGACGPYVELVSGGSSTGLPWALGEEPTGRTNNLRLGEAILLGVEPLTGQPISGLHADAFTFFAEVIETGSKPCAPPRQPVAPAPGMLRLVRGDDRKVRTILAVGKQDTDPGGLGFPSGVTYLGATSDHTVTGSAKATMPVGSEMKMSMDYSALMRAMNAPDVTKVLRGKKALNATNTDRDARPQLTLV